MEYIKRIADDLIDYYAQYAGAIYIRGPKWAGKTTTAIRHAKTVYRLGVNQNLSRFNDEYDVNPEGIFSNERPILFDEWQEAPYLWDEIKNRVDMADGDANQFFLTGSRELSKKDKEKYLRHTGVGRILDMVLYPLSLYESGESDGSISLSGLFKEGYSVNGCKSSLSIEDLVFAACRGGWPKSLAYSSPEIALDQAKLVFSSLINRDDIGNDEDDLVDNGNPLIVQKFLHAYSKSVSTLRSDEDILRLMRGGDAVSISRPTYDSYKKKLSGQYVIEEVEPWNPNFKSRADVSQTPKKEFVDPSIGIAAAGLSPAKMMSSLIDFGFFFENLCIRDLRIYSSKERGRVAYYHDRNGKECDAVLILRDNRYALIECKLGMNAAKAAADGLVKIVEAIKANNAACKDKSQIMDLPSALIVLHGGNLAMTLPNGVHLVPIGCLKD